MVAEGMWWFIGIVLGIAGAILSLFGQMQYRKAYSQKYYIMSMIGTTTSMVVLFMLFALAIMV